MLTVEANIKDIMRLSKRDLTILRVSLSNEKL